MKHKFNNPNEIFEILEIMEKLGLLDEFDEKIEAQKLKERDKLVRDRFILRTTRNKVMPGLGKEVEAATEALKLAEANRLAADQAYHAAIIRNYGATLTYSEDKLNSQIEAAAPKFMHDAYDQVQKIFDGVRGVTRYWREPVSVGWGLRYIDMSNADEISALMETCKDAQAKIRELMYDVHTPIEEQRKYCAAIVRKVVEAAHPHLKNDERWLADQEKKGKSKN